MRLIDADALINTIKELPWDLKKPSAEISRFIFLDTVEEATTIDPVKHGMWVMNSDFPDRIICTVCNAGFDVWKHDAQHFNYCPNCGAKMYADRMVDARHEPFAEKRGPA